MRAAALVLVAAGVALASYEVDPAARAQPLPAGDLIGLIGEQATARSGAVFFPEYRFLEDVPEDARVVVDLGAPEVRFVYPLFGPEHRREVLPAGGDAPPAGRVGRDGRRTAARHGAGAATTAGSSAADAGGVRVWRPRP